MVPAVRRPRLGATLLLSLLLPAPLLLAGCTGGGSEPKSAPPSQSATPLQSLKTTELVVPRQGFCPMVAPAEVATALGGQPTTSTSYDNGQRAWLTDQVRDVSHEYGCSWRMHKRATARAWVFAPPITPARARELVRSATGGGCSAVSAPDFGAPSVSTRCAGEDGVTEGYFGLFGDAWLGCTLHVQDRNADLSQRTSRWCATVLSAAAS